MIGVGTTLGERPARIKRFRAWLKADALVIDYAPWHKPRWKNGPGYQVQTIRGSHVLAALLHRRLQEDHRWLTGCGPRPGRDSPKARLMCASSAVARAPRRVPGSCAGRTVSVAIARGICFCKPTTASPVDCGRHGEHDG